MLVKNDQNCSRISLATRMRPDSYPGRWEFLHLLWTFLTWRVTVSRLTAAKPQRMHTGTATCSNTWRVIRFFDVETTILRARHTPAGVNHLRSHGWQFLRVVELSWHPINEASNKCNSETLIIKHHDLAACGAVKRAKNQNFHYICCKFDEKIVIILTKYHIYCVRPKYSRNVLH